MIRGEIMFTQTVGDRRFGWTEDHYIRGTGNLKVALLCIGELAAARSQLLGAGVGINFLRVSDTTKLNDSQVLPGLQFTTQYRVQKNEIIRVEPLVPERQPIDFILPGNVTPPPQAPTQPAAQPAPQEMPVFLAPKLTTAAAEGITELNSLGSRIGQQAITFFADGSLASTLAGSRLVPLYIGAPNLSGYFKMYNPDMNRGVAQDQLADLIVDQPRTGLLLRLEGGRNYTARRAHLIRGLPDIAVRTDRDKPFTGGSALEANLFEALASYSARLMDGRFGMKTLRTGPANPERAVSGWAVVGSPPSVQATIPGLNAQVGEKVRIRGVTVRSIAQQEMTFSASLRVHSRTGDVYTFVPGAVRTPFVASLILQREIIRAGFALRVLYDVEPYTKVIVRRWGSKDAGAGFDPAKGARKKKRKAVRKK